jgi:crotonobetainyl-CoA:carnitine CoA-transferase CaiB-like acyl-CoA transferase
MRHIGTPGMGPIYLYVNRNKRSLCLDLKDKASWDVAEKLRDHHDSLLKSVRDRAQLNADL